MNGISMSTNIVTPKTSSTALVLDFVVSTTKLNHRFEQQNAEIMKKKAELEAKLKEQNNKKDEAVKVDIKLKKEVKEPKKAETHEVKLASKTANKPKVEDSKKGKEIGKKIDSKF